MHVNMNVSVDTIGRECDIIEDESVKREQMMPRHIAPPRQANMQVKHLPLHRSDGPDYGSEGWGSESSGRTEG
jgi:hypothetical protein